MITKEITIASKQVTIAYCFSTEIAFKLLSDENIETFFKEVSECLSKDPQEMPDTRKTIFLILAAVNAYYDSKDEEPPLTDKDLMYKCTPTEQAVALGTIIGMRTTFYHVPSDEPEDEKPKKGGKKAKNA